jgi:Bacterial Ig-like domain (group 2)
MNRKGLGHVSVFAGLIFWFINLSGCGHDQQLTAIHIQPSTQDFGASNVPVAANAGSSVQLRALGSFIHPPVTKDITDQVVWNSNTPDMVTVSSTGLLTATGLACGNALVSATVTTDKSTGNLHSSGALVTGSMTANVICFTGTGPAVTLTFAGTGAGTVASSPAGLGCSTSCSASFVSGTVVTLTATPNGSTFGGWSGCDSTSGAACTIALNTDRAVTVTFN